MGHDMVVIFVLSLILSSIGVSLDLYSTSVFMKDLGIEFEWNKRVKFVVSRFGFMTWIFIEAIVIIIFGILDLIMSSIISFGLIWFFARGLVATRNFQIITEYKMIGIDLFKKNVKSRLKATQNISYTSKIKLKLPYLIEVSICLIIYVLLLTAEFPFIVPIRSLIVGLIIFNMLRAIVS